MAGASPKTSGKATASRRTSRSRSRSPPWSPRWRQPSRAARRRATWSSISAEAEKKLAQGIEAYQKGDIATAIEHLREGTRIDPLAYRLHFHLGLLYGKQGRIYDAIQELQTALDINRHHFPALKNLAVLYQKAGFRNKAIETWERALRVAPDDATRQSIKEHLVGLL